MDTAPHARRSGYNDECHVQCCFSMEECEALCTRMAVMVNGRFQCLGSTQHLKDKFGAGYSLIIKLRVHRAGEVSSETSLEIKTRALMEYVRSAFPNSQLKDQHDGLVHYRIGRAPGLTWARLFGAVERVRSMYDIEDYSVSQTTLEQVFISFARMQHEPQEIMVNSGADPGSRRGWFVSPPLPSLSFPPLPSLPLRSHPTLPSLRSRLP